MKGWGSQPNYGSKNEPDGTNTGAHYLAVAWHTHPLKGGIEGLGWGNNDVSHPWTVHRESCREGCPGGGQGRQVGKAKQRLPLALSWLALALAPELVLLNCSLWHWEMDSGSGCWGLWSCWLACLSLSTHDLPALHILEYSLSSPRKAGFKVPIFRWKKPKLGEVKKILHMVEIELQFGLLTPHPMSQPCQGSTRLKKNKVLYDLKKRDIRGFFKKNFVVFFFTKIILFYFYFLNNFKVAEKLQKKWQELPYTFHPDSPSL